MKTELREITIQRPVFIADDGTEFDSENACGAYEIDCLEKTLKCYEEDYTESNIESCSFVDLTTDEDVETFKTVCDFHGVVSDGVDKPGLYMFDDTYRDSTWVNLDEVISNIRGVTNDQT